MSRGEPNKKSMKERNESHQLNSNSLRSRHRLASIQSSTTYPHLPMMRSKKVRSTCSTDGEETHQSQLFYHIDLHPQVEEDQVSQANSNSISIRLEKPPRAKMLLQLICRLQLRVLVKHQLTQAMLSFQRQEPWVVSG